MKAFALLFVAMAAYGFYTNHIGGALISVFMSGFVVYGARQLDKRDAEFYATPAGAKQVADTLELMRQQGCECTGSRF